MKDPLESKRKPCEYFIPRKYAVPKQGGKVRPTKKQIFLRGE